MKSFPRTLENLNEKHFSAHLKSSMFQKTELEHCCQASAITQTLLPSIGDFIHTFLLKHCLPSIGESWSIN